MVHRNPVADPAAARLRSATPPPAPTQTGWSRRASIRLVLAGLLVLGMVAISVFIGGYVTPTLPASTYRAFSMLDRTIPDTNDPGVPGAAAPGTDPSAGDDPIVPGTDGTSTKPADLAPWATPLATKLGIPLPAVQAYGYAELATATTQPTCQLRWTTLAGIGKVESSHGQAHATIAPDGKVLPPIVGAPLDGLGGRIPVPDTDGGKIDGDRTWDHAIGPMQFIPSTWNRYAADADGDGVADINDIDDAALAAAHYLCSGNRNLSIPGDWWAAILSYNAVQAYAQDVFNGANDYGQRSH